MKHTSVLYNQRYVDMNKSTYTGSSETTSHKTGEGQFDKTWDVTQNYAEKKVKGERLETNHFLAVDYREDRPMGSLTYWPTSNPGNWTTITGAQRDPYTEHFTLPLLGYSWESIADANAKAIINLHEDIKQTKVNLAQVFGERKQTIDLVASTATRLVKSFRALRRGDIFSCLNQLAPGAKENRRTVTRFANWRKRWAPTDDKLHSRASSFWLELQYGWLPLLSDVYGAVALVSETKKRDFINYADGFAKQVHVQTTNRRVGHGDALLLTDTLSIGYRVHYRVRYSVTDLAPRLLAETGITNPALFAWELTPFSFIGDWFVPIGTYLSTMDATVGIKFLSGTKSSKLLEYRSVDSQGTNNTGVDGSWTYTGTTSGTSKYRGFARDRLYGFPNVSLPVFKNPISPVHMANSIALLQQVFGSRR